MNISCLHSLSSKDFSMPADFAQHRCTIMLWPERSDIWRNRAEPIQRKIAELARLILNFEPVRVGVIPSQYEKARSSLPGSVDLFEISYNDIWIRDISPTFIVKGKEIRGVDWIFNAWGGVKEGLYFPWDLDNEFSKRLLETYSFPMYVSDMVLEGGAITVDGEGTLITTLRCLVNQNRNPFMNKDDIESKLKALLNVQKIIWLRQGLLFDETGGHVDNLCVFARPGEVMLAWTNDSNHPQYPICQEAYKILCSCTDAKGRRLLIHKIELPEPMEFTEEECRGIDYRDHTIRRKPGNTLLGSYINFIHLNGAVIIPEFGCKQDDEVRRQFISIFPDKEVVSINVREIILGGGGIHCITTHIPFV